MKDYKEHEYTEDFTRRKENEDIGAFIGGIVAIIGAILTILIINTVFEKEYGVSYFEKPEISHEIKHNKKYGGKKVKFICPAFFKMPYETYYTFEDSDNYYIYKDGFFKKIYIREQAFEKCTIE